MKVFNLGSSLGKLHFGGWIACTILTTAMVFAETKMSRMYILIAVLVLQHATFLLFMVDYERLGKENWKKREEKLREELEQNLYKTYQRIKIIK